MLYAVMVVITVGALACTTMIVRADAHRTAVRANLEQLRLRAIAWSGVQGVTLEMERQRGTLLDGGDPQLTREWTVWESGGRRGIVRLLPVVEGGDAVMRSESACLDVNLATAGMLAKLPGMSEDLAGRLVAARGAGGLSSPESLGAVPGFTADVLVGVEDAGPKDAGVLAYLTAFASDVNQQMGLTREGRGHAGTPRVHLSQGWSPEVESSLKERVSVEGLAAARACLQARGITTEAGVVEAVRKAGYGAGVSGEVLDVLTVRDDAYPRGRIDVNRASAEVLACVPGFDATSAERAMASRAGVSAEDRRNPAWLVDAGVLTDEQFKEASGWIATRSLVWRVRLEAVIEAAGETSADTRVEGRMEWEAVVDAAGPEARLAYLRDVTFVRQAVMRVTEAEAREAEARAREPAVAEEPPPPAVPPPGPGAAEREQRRRAPIGTSRAAGVNPEAKDARSEGQAVDQEETRARSAPSFQDRRIGRWRGRGV
ncbi:MAG: hypothetical protein HBSAPP03_21890 [Phycisphaerae bacterium]|nr:MAG: hypothetical protein HBSAPP03_21890 [Phycisphaerae bacterium]